KQAIFSHWPVFPTRRIKEVSEIGNNLGSRQLEHIQARLPGSQFQVWRRPAANLQDLEGFVNNDAGRRIFLNGHSIRFTLHILKRRCHLENLTPGGHRLSSTADWKIEPERSGDLLLRIEFVCPVLESEQTRKLANAFGPSQPQDPAWIERVMRNRNTTRLQCGCEIDE